jgi:hypothetical protein
METIIEPNKYFDFTKISLANPINLQGGAYFTKIEYGNKSLYIQSCKSLTKQGFIKSGKKIYCDLMFDKNSETIINWIEKLEEHCQKLIFDKNEEWFQNSLEEDELSSAFNSIMRIYKSGKYYLVRCNIKNNSLGLPNIKIYDENEDILTLNDVTENTSIISIIEIQGIKFTKRNFMIEIELKQVMVLENNLFFDNCLIKSKKTELSYQPINTIIPLPQTNIDDFHEMNYDINKERTDLAIINKLVLPLEDLTQLDFKEPEDLTHLDFKEPKDLTHLDFKEPEDLTHLDFKEPEDLTHLDFKELEELDEPEDLTELDFNEKNNINDLEPLQLKKPNQVYFDLYNEARNKAKLAKKNAILAFLEAKNIKKTYMIENINDEDDIDDEIDEASESDLEGF